MEVLDTDNEIINSPNAIDLSNVQGSIEFDNVSFQYEDGVPVISKINFSCKPGEMIALLVLLG